MSERDEWARRRNETLTHYPEVARVGNLADALTQTLAKMGSSLTASPPFPLDQPVFSPFNDHADAPGKTLPEFATVSVHGRRCKVSIAFFQFPLGTYGLRLFDEDQGRGGVDRETHTLLAGDLGSVIADDLATVALIVHRAVEDGEDLADLARSNGAIYVPPQRFRSTPTFETSAERMLANILMKLEEADPNAVERYRRVRHLLKQALEQDGKD